MVWCDFSKVLWFIFVFGVNAFDGTEKRRRGYVSNVVTYNDLDDQQQQEMQSPPLGLFQDLWLASSQKQTQTALPVPYNYETTHTVQANEPNEPNDNHNHNNFSNEFHKEFYKENTELNNGNDDKGHNDDKPIPFVHDMVKKPKQRNRVRLLPMPMKPEEFYHPVPPAKVQNAQSVSVDMNPNPHHIVPNVYEYQSGVVPRQPTNEMDSETFILGGPFDQTPHTKGVKYVSSPADNNSGENSYSHGGNADDDNGSSESDDSDDMGGDELFQMMPDPMTNIQPGHLVGTKIRVAATPALEVYFSIEQNPGRNI